MNLRSLRDDWRNNLRMKFYIEGIVRGLIQYLLCQNGKFSPSVGFLCAIHKIGKFPPRSFSFLAFFQAVAVILLLQVIFSPKGLNFSRPSPVLSKLLKIWTRLVINRSADLGPKADLSKFLSISSQ